MPYISMQSMLAIVVGALCLLHVDAATVQCLVTGSMSTWDKSTFPACNASICAGSDSLKVMEPPSTRVQLLTPEQYKVLAARLTTKEIPHAYNPIHVGLVRKLTEYQHSMGIFGTVAELGVHNGGFFLALAGVADASESLAAMDLFNEQNLNVDGSGFVLGGNFRGFSHQLVTSGLKMESVALFPGNSLYLDARAIVARNLPQFRIFSVDGGHTLELTMHDLMLAACVVAEGGIVILDDFANTKWAGVVQAGMLFSMVQDRLMPFMWTSNKLYFTTPSHHARYLVYVKESEPTMCSRPQWHSSRTTIGSSDVCLGYV